jgi:uncharacterized protein YfiM (DUF2279 family)
LKRTLVAATLLAASATASATEDLAAHAGASAVIASALTVLFEDGKEPVLYAIATTMAIGLAKEIHDSRSGESYFSGADLAADLLGATLGAGATGLIVTPRFVGFRTTW